MEEKISYLFLSIILFIESVLRLMARALEVFVMSILAPIALVSTYPGKACAILFVGGFTSEYYFFGVKSGGFPIFVAALYLGVSAGALIFALENKNRRF